MRILSIRDYRKWVVRLYIKLQQGEDAQDVYYDVHKEKWAYQGDRVLDVDFEWLEDRVKFILIKHIQEFGDWYFSGRPNLLRRIKNYDKKDSEFANSVEFKEIANYEYNIVLENGKYIHNYFKDPFMSECELDGVV